MRPGAASPWSDANVYAVLDAALGKLLQGPPGPGAAADSLPPGGDRHPEGRELQHHAIDNWMERGYQALGVRETHLKVHDFFAADRYTIADIALYAYTHIAHECDYDLTAFPATRAWLQRVADEPRHVGMEFNPAAAAVVE